jgi:predicted dehydrogenase
MRVAIVGLGYWGPNLVRNLAVSEACSELVVCDTDEHRLKAIEAQYPFADATDDYSKILNDPDVSAVVVSTPVATHAPLAEAALNAGKSVLVEKPIAASSADARALIELARMKGLLVMAGHTFLYSAPVRTVRNLIENDGLGDVLYIHSSRVNLGIHQSEVSVLWDLAPHDLSILLYWLDEWPSAVSATGRSCFANRPVDIAFVDLAFPSGIVANLHLSWLAPTKMRRITLVCRRQMVVFEDTNAEEPVKVYDRGLDMDLPDPQDFGEYQLTYRLGDIVAPRVPTTEPLRVEVEDFLGRVAREEVPGDAEEAAIAIVTAVEAAERSLVGNGEWVPTGLAAS